MQLRSLLIFIYGLIIIDFLPVYQVKVLAKNSIKNNEKVVNEKYNFLKLDSFEKSNKFSTKFNLSKNEVIEDLNTSGAKLFNLLALEDNNFKKKYFVEINSDIQYREKEIFNAKGNAIIYLSNATLKGDLITYDLKNKLLTVVGNVHFKKGKQFFKATKLFYDLKKDKGYIDNVYGIYDSDSFKKDFKLDINDDSGSMDAQKTKNKLINLKDLNSSAAELINEFDEDNNLTNFGKEIQPSKITRWRYKTEKLIYNSKKLESKEIIFTNDLYNEPQLIFLSRNFSAAIIKNKLSLISKNSWIILDKKLKIPLGERSFFEGESLTTWGIGADYSDKDGYYLFRSSSPKKIFRDYSFNLQKYFLFQRAIQGSTKSFTTTNSSIWSDKVSQETKFTDYFAIDLNLKGKEKNWDVQSKIQLNSLNTERLDESLRTKFTLTRRINLVKKNDSDINFKNNNIKNFSFLENRKDFGSHINDGTNFNLEKKYSQKSNDLFSNFLDFQIYNIFREKVIKDFATEEIYFASGFSASNKKNWLKDNKFLQLSLIYDFGHFKSKRNQVDEFTELFRNSFVAQYSYRFPIWRKSSLDKTIDKSYIYSPKVISQSLNWETGLQSGYFLYSDDSSQSALKFNSGPVLTLGGLKKKFLDYSQFSANYIYVLKNGASPFSFDDIDDDTKINFSLEQQVYGPLILGFGTTLNLNNGNYTDANYSLNFKRRAYSIGAFYNSSEESLGVRFNIFNFNYSGIGPKF